MHTPWSYEHVGAALMLAGGIAVPIFFFVVGSIALTALALSAMLLGVISLLLARSLPAIPPQAARLLLEAGQDNLAGLIEELGVDARAIYLPSIQAGGRPRALVPLRADSSRPDITRPLPRRMVVSFGPNPEDMGILVATPGSAVMPLLETPPGRTSSGMEAALTRVLVGVLDVASSVQVTQESGRVTATVGGPRLDMQNLAAFHVIGTPIASVVASVVAEGLGRPVTIMSEERTGESLMVQLEVTP